LRRGAAVAAAVIAAGVALRVGQLLEGHSLWGDEAMLAVNVIARSYAELTQPLDLAQSAPIVFLWVERALYQLLGPTELAFRFLPFVASCLLLPVFYRVSSQLLDQRIALIGLTILVCAAPLIGYAAEAKPYALDALVACLLIGGYAAVLRDPSPGRWALLLAGGLVAMLCSTSSIFVLAALGAATAFETLRGRLQRRAMAFAAVVAVAWVALFDVLYARMFRDAATREYMDQFWGHAFITPGAGFPDRLADGIAAVFNPIGALTYPPLMLPLFVLGFTGGAVVLVRRGKSEIAALAAAPVVLAFVASAVGRYPLSGRLMFFAVPGVTLLVAVAMVGAADHIDRATFVRSRWSLACALLPLAVVASAGLFFRSRPYEELRPTVPAFRELASPEDPVYVFNRNAPTWLFYTLEPERLDRGAIEAVVQHVSPGGLAQMNGPSRGPRPRGEGASLVYRDGGRSVLLGVASGSQFRAGLGFVPPAVDSGWAQNEAARIRAAADSTIWMVMADYGRGEPQESAAVLRAVEAAGASLALAFSAGNTRLYRARFP
jgi:hypothetical protein